MDIQSAYKEAGTLRGAAAICGTTHKTVKRILEAAERTEAGVAVKRERNFDGVREAVADKIGTCQGRISAKRLLPLARAAGYEGSPRNFRRLVAEEKAVVHALQTTGVGLLVHGTAGQTQQLCNLALAPAIERMMISPQINRGLPVPPSPGEVKSPGAKSAIRMKELAIDPSTLRRTQEGDKIGAVLGNAQTIEGRFTFDPGFEFGSHPAGLCRSRVDDIRSDAKSLELLRRRNGDAIQSALARSIGQVANGVIAREGNDSTPTWNTLITDAELSDQEPGRPGIYGEVSVETLYRRVQDP